MIVYLISVAVLAVFSPGTIVESVCQIGDCSLPTMSNCSQFGKISTHHFVARQPPRSTIDDPDHLFNMLYNPFENDCLYLRVDALNNNYLNNKFALILECAYHHSRISAVNFEVTFQQSNGARSLQCISRNATSMQLGVKCGIFANEQLRLTFSNDQLLMEDLSSKVPEGTSLLLSKTDYQRNKQCVCQNLTLFWIKKQPCFFKNL